MLSIDKTVVVGELDEGLRPDFLDAPNLCNHLVHRFYPVAGREANGGSAKLAVERAASLGLDRETVVLLRIQQFESRHGRGTETERRAARIVNRSQLAAFHVVHHRRPDRFALAQHDAVRVLQGFIGQGRYVQAAENDDDAS